jgi:hypothetical protein
MITKRLIIFGVIVTLVIGVGFFYVLRSVSAEVANLNIYNGSVDVVSGGNTKVGLTGTPIHVKDLVKVASGSRVSIILKDGTVIRLEAGSEVQIANLEYDGKIIKNAVFSLTIGRLWSRVKPLSQGANFQVETPTTVATVRGTSFGTDYQNSQSDIYVSSRLVGVNLKSSQIDTKEVIEDQLFTLRDGFLKDDFDKGPILAPSSFKDDWVMFNEREDIRLGEGGDIALPTDGLDSTNVDSVNSPNSASLSTGTDGSKSGPLKSSTSGVSNYSTGSFQASGGGVTSQIKETVNLVLTPQDATVVVQEELQLKVLSAYSNGEYDDVTKIVAWSQNPWLGPIDNLGIFRGSKEGRTTIVASFDGLKSNNISVTVLAGQKKLSAIEVVYRKVQGGFSVAYDSLITAQFTAVAKYNDGSTEDVTQKTSWSVEPNGSANGRIDVNGLYTSGSSEGVDMVSANYDGMKQSTQIKIP